jgi:hypothetical protein
MVKLRMVAALNVRSADPVAELRDLVLGYHSTL